MPSIVNVTVVVLACAVIEPPAIADAIAVTASSSQCRRFNMA